MAEAPAPPNELTVRYRAAMDRLAAGDLGAAVPVLLDIHEKNLQAEEAFFCEEHLTRIRRNWPVEAEKAGLTADAWAAVQKHAAERRADKAAEGQDFVAVGLCVAVAAWCFMMAAAPRAAFLGRGPDPVPLLFKIVSSVVGIVSAATGFGLMKRKWEAVNVFIILSPIFMIVTFIGLTEAGDTVGKALCAAALGLEIYAAWYMSKNANRFIY